MERKIGYSEMGRKSFAALNYDLAKIQHEAWRKQYGASNPKCDIPYEQLPTEESQKNYMCVRAILQALDRAGYLKF